MKRDQDNEKRPQSQKQARVESEIHKLQACGRGRSKRCTRRGKLQRAHALRQMPAVVADADCGSAKTQRKHTWAAGEVLKQVVDDGVIAKRWR